MRLHRRRVGAGYSNQRQLARRVAVRSSRGDGSSTASLPDYQTRKRRARGIFNYRDRCASRGGVVEKIVAIAVPATHRDEQLPTLDLSAIVRYASAILRQVAVDSDEQAMTAQCGFDVCDSHVSPMGE